MNRPAMCKYVKLQILKALLVPSGLFLGSAQGQRVPQCPKGCKDEMLYPPRAGKGSLLALCEPALFDVFGERWKAFLCCLPTTCFDVIAGAKLGALTFPGRAPQSTTQVDCEPSLRKPARCEILSFQTWSATATQQLEHRDLTNLVHMKIFPRPGVENYKTLLPPHTSSCAQRWPLQPAVHVGNILASVQILSFGGLTESIALCKTKSRRESNLLLG